MTSGEKETKKAQIMLITLVVLMILGIIVVGIVIVINRDTQETVANQKYEQVLNTAESNLQSIVQKYGNYSIALSSLPSDFNVCSPVVANIEYNCTFQNQDFSSISLTTQVNVQNTKDVREFEIKKDRSLVINLYDAAITPAGGYKAGLELTWDNASALDFTLIYTDGSGKDFAIKDVYDESNIYESLVGDDPIGDPAGIHQLDFQALDLSNLQTSVRIALGTSTIPAGVTIKSLRITPRMDATFGSIHLSLEAGSKSNFPYQMREFKSTSYDQLEGQTTPVVNVLTQIPLTPQTDSIFDYSFITNDTIEFN